VAHADHCDEPTWRSPNGWRDRARLVRRPRNLGTQATAELIRPRFPRSRSPPDRDHQRPARVDLLLPTGRDRPARRAPRPTTRAAASGPQHPPHRSGPMPSSKPNKLWTTASAADSSVSPRTGPTGCSWHSIGTPPAPPSFRSATRSRSYVATAHSPSARPLTEQPAARVSDSREEEEARSGSQGSCGSALPRTDCASPRSGPRAAQDDGDVDEFGGDSSTIANSS
jgi:hypothetical protein